MLIRLDLSTEERWTPLIGEFAILHGPVTSAIMSEAGHASFLPDENPDEVSPQERTARIVRFIARAIIRDWRGVADEATGETPPVTPATVDAVLDIYPIFRAFNERVIDARIRIDREKKGLPTLRNGTSGSEPNTAPTATGSAPTAPEG
jgi:hypothetical protein